MILTLSIILGVLIVFAFFYLRKKEPPRRTDKDVPMGIRVGGTLQIELPPELYLDEKGELLFQDPKSAYTVDKIGYFDLLGNRYWRIYFTDGLPCFLEIVNGEIYLFSIYDEVFPETKKEWDDWLSADDRLIGSPVFQVIPDNSEPVDFVRHLRPGKNTISPLVFTETILLDGIEGGEESEMFHQSMLYSGSVVEGLLEEFIWVESLEDLEGAFINIFSGLKLEEDSILVLPPVD